jgi:hypothetical protein
MESPFNPADLEQSCNVELYVGEIPRRFLRLHPDTAAVGALPFPLLVIDVPLQFFHGQFTNLARHLFFNVAGNDAQ